MTSSSSSRITAVRPLWAVEGGRVTIAGDGLRRRSRLPRGAASAACRRGWRRASPRALTALVPPGLDGGRTPVRIDERRRRDRVRRDRRAARDRPAPGRQPGVRSRRQPLRDLQRLARAGGAGLDLRRPAATARASRSSSGIANPTSLAFDRDGRLYVSSRFDGSVYRVDADGSRRRRSRPTSASRAASRSTPDGDAVRRRSIRNDPARRATGTRRVFASHARRASPRSTWRSAPTAGCTSPRPTLGAHDCVYRISPDGAVEIVLRRLRPAAGAGLRSRRAICTSSMRWPARAASIGCDSDRPAEPELVVAGGSLIGLAFDPRGGLVAGVERHRVPLSP